MAKSHKYLSKKKVGNKWVYKYKETTKKDKRTPFEKTGTPSPFSTFKRDFYNEYGKTNIGKHLYDDDFWKGPKELMDLLDKVAQKHGWVWNIEGTKYEQDENMNPVRKIWKIKLTNGKTDRYGFLTAHGAGTVSEPLKKYDITLTF